MIEEILISAADNGWIVQIKYKSEPGILFDKVTIPTKILVAYTIEELLGQIRSSVETQVGVG